MTEERLSMIEQYKKMFNNDAILANTLGYGLYKIYRPDRARLLNNNIKFKNSYKGKRCFVLGNGPSLKDQDISLLKDEYVFTVNQFCRYPISELIKPNFHFWVDDVFFKVDKNKSEDMELISIMKKIAEINPEVECFFPISKKNFIEEFELNNYLKVNYFLPSIKPIKMRNKDIDYCKYVPGFGTVVQTALSMAIYMGFKEIYLLGCDTTSIIVNIKSALHSNDENDYAYDLTNNEKKRLEQSINKQSMETFAKSYYETLIAYRLLYQHCSTRNIKLINCSAQTVIDSIPRKCLKDVLF